MTVLADTHALHWFLTDPERLSRAAFDSLHEAERDDLAGIAVSVASRIDLHYLVARGRLDAELADQVWAVTTHPDVNVRAVSLTPPIAERFGDPGLARLRDPWDRFILATAIELNVPLVTKDSLMTEIGTGTGVVEVLW